MRCWPGHSDDLAGIVAELRKPSFLAGAAAARLRTSFDAERHGRLSEQSPSVSVFLSEHNAWSKLRSLHAMSRRTDSQEGRLSRHESTIQALLQRWRKGYSERNPTSA